ncbi:MAG: XRE family transcriptional regulator [Symploca sp. SIO1B1]|nr:XRE family transcriptional regulator [Symploca sp. SIO1C2]NER49147.1 XRE family transcriptional regulator [Symploca sp. SIO1A3]NER98408.1 XRE family transcriptional regulator [Symploca sp. SIO1B1]
MNKIQDLEYEQGSGNVFADLELDDAEELFARSQIGFYLYENLKKRNLQQGEIATILGISQPDVSHLMNGHFSRFTMEKLLDFFKCLNMKVTIEISPHQEGEPFQKVAYLS